jgi:hypothetical protein
MQAFLAMISPFRRGCLVGRVGWVNPHAGMIAQTSEFAGSCEQERGSDRIGPARSVSDLEYRVCQAENIWRRLV